MNNVFFVAPRVFENYLHIRELDHAGNQLNNIGNCVIFKVIYLPYIVLYCFSKSFFIIYYYLVLFLNYYLFTISWHIYN